MRAVVQVVPDEIVDSLVVGVFVLEQSFIGSELFFNRSDTNRDVGV